MLKMIQGGALLGAMAAGALFGFNMLALGTASSGIPMFGTTDVGSGMADQAATGLEAFAVCIVIWLLAKIAEKRAA